MPLSIILSSLASRITRTTSTGGSGIRRFASNASRAIQEAQEQEPTNFWDGLKRFGASILANINWQPPWIRFTVSGLMGLFINGVQQILNFNWNATDAQLDEQLKQQEIAIAAARGGLKGQFVGRLVCGIAPTAVLATFNEALALHVLMEVGEEAAEEIAASASVLIQLTLRKTINTAFVNIFKNFRGLLRGTAIGFGRLLQNLGILDEEAVDKANKQRNQPWSIHSALEETIERVEDPAQEAELEEFWEEFGEACIESGYIIAGSIDSFFMQQRAQESAASASEHTVIMSPSGAIGSTTIVSSPSTNP